MKQRAWRITRKEFAGEALTGEGARRFPGRWNRRGVPMVYAAESLALAVLEVLVHLEREDALREFVQFQIEFDPRYVLKLSAENLPKDWAAPIILDSTREMGSNWAVELKSAVLAVPSAIIPSETIFLLNPLHADFRRIRMGEPRPFGFDGRCIKK